jgi:hypothetical protein
LLIVNKAETISMHMLANALVIVGYPGACG